MCVMFNGNQRSFATHSPPPENIDQILDQTQIYQILVGPGNSERDITLTIKLISVKAVQIMNWVISGDYLGQPMWNLGFIVLQFSCVGNFESSQALSERVERGGEGQVNLPTAKVQEGWLSGGD